MSKRQLAVLLTMSPILATCALQTEASAVYETAVLGPGFESIPAGWIASAAVAVTQFRRRHPSNLSCFDTTLRVEQDGLLHVSFLPVRQVEVTTERIVIQHSRECGLGETFKFDAGGRLVEHVFVRH